jgi:hypothetical protein
MSTQHEAAAEQLISPVRRTTPWPGEYITEPPSSENVNLANVHMALQMVGELRLLRQSLDEMRAAIETLGGVQR